MLGRWRSRTRNVRLYRQRSKSSHKSRQFINLPWKSKANSSLYQAIFRNKITIPKSHNHKLFNFHKIKKFSQTFFHDLKLQKNSFYVSSLFEKRTSGAIIDFFKQNPFSCKFCLIKNLYSRTHLGFLMEKYEIQLNLFNLIPIC